MPQAKVARNSETYAERARHGERALCYPDYVLLAPIRGAAPVRTRVKNAADRTLA